MSGGLDFSSLHARNSQESIDLGGEVPQYEQCLGKCTRAGLHNEARKDTVLDPHGQGQGG